MREREDFLQNLICFFGKTKTKLMILILDFKRREVNEIERKKKTQETFLNVQFLLRVTKVKKNQNKRGKLFELYSKLKS